VTQDKAILEALAAAIQAAMDGVHDMDVTHADYAKAGAAAVLELMRPKRLVWEVRGDRYWAAETALGMAYISEYPSMDQPFKLDARDYSNHMMRCPTLGAAQSAAQAHADAQWIASLPLGDLIGGQP